MTIDYSCMVMSSTCFEPRHPFPTTLLMSRIDKGTSFNIFNHDAVWAEIKTLDLPNDERVQTIGDKRVALLKNINYI